MKSTIVAMSLWAVLLAAGCGGKPKGGGGGAAVPLTPGAWEGMTPEQRGAFMKQTVMPTIAGKFRAFDSTAFASMDCKTCHGQGADDGSFEMPNPNLPALRGDQIMNPDAEHAAITEFMKNEVRPTMATLLGLPEWTPDAPEGFGCYGCHPMP